MHNYAKKLDMEAKELQFILDLEFIQNILPKRYKCETREQGVYCYDTTGRGINDDHKASDKHEPEFDNQWALICKAIKQKFGERLMEIYSQEPQYHSKFAIYLRPHKN